MSSPYLPPLSLCLPPHLLPLTMLYSPHMSKTLPRTTATKSSVELSPLSWAQYLGASPQTSLKSNETEVQRMRRMQKMFRTWRDEQVLRARLRRPSRSVSHPPVISPPSPAVTPETQNTATIAPTLDGAPQRTPTLSSCDLRGLLDTPWGPSMEFRQLARRGRSRSTGTLSPHQDVYAATLSTAARTTKKTTKMPRKYRKYAKMPRGWKMEEVDDDEVEEVWGKQKEALSDSTIPGRLTRSAYKRLRAPTPLSPVGSK